MFAKPCVFPQKAFSSLCCVTLQMLPFTPISEQLLTLDWVTTAYPVVARALPTAAQGWKVCSLDYVFANTACSYLGDKVGHWSSPHCRRGAANHRARAGKCRPAVSIGYHDAPCFRLTFTTKDLPELMAPTPVQGFIYMDYAVIAKEAAWAEVQTLTAFDDGNSKTNTLWWVATRP